jgi:membrane-associated phospholipid phosphatase
MAPAHGRGGARGLAVQVGLVAAGFVFYLGVRAVTVGERTTAIRHGQDVLRVERVLGLDWERAGQAFTIHHEWLRDVFDTVYASVYWPMLIGALLVLWRWDRRRYVILRDAMAISGAVGLLVFALYPVAPPRMLDGYVDTVSASARQHFIAHPSSLVNPYAALPSFHAGWVALAALFLAVSARHRIVRAVALVPAPLMAVTVVVTANHYIVDVIAGVGLSLLGAAVAVRLHRPRAVPPAGGPAPGPTAVPEPSGAPAGSVLVRMSSTTPDGWQLASSPEAGCRS